MELAERYPEIALKIAFGTAAGLFLAAILFLLSRKVPRVRVPSALLFGLLLGASGDRLAEEIRQRGLDDGVLSAAGKGDAPALRRALDAGGSPVADESTSGGIVALAYALDSGNPGAVELLLQRGADPQYGSWTEGSGLEIAAKRKRPDLTALLKRYGAQ